MKWAAKRTRPLAALFLLLLPACTVGPNFHPVKVTGRATFNELNPAPTQQSHPTQAAPNLAAWWTTFNDSTLNDLIHRAVQANPDLQQAQARVLQARAQRGVVGADLFPTVDANASYSRNRGSANAFSGVGTTAGTQTNFWSAGFDAAWELDIFGGVRRDIEAADADLAASVADRRDVLVTLLSEVARNYIELRSSQRRIAIAQDNLKAQQETLRVTQTRFQAGLTSDLDVARAEAQVQTTGSQIPALETSARQSMHMLATLLGLEPSSLIDELSAATPIPAAPPEVPVGLPSQLLRRRPDVRKAEFQLEASTARIGVATADLFPKFSLTGSLGVQSTHFSNWISASSRFWSIGPSVSWPIIDFGKIRSQIQVQNALEEQAFSTYKKTVLTSFREVEDALIAFGKEQARWQSLDRAVQANQRATNLANTLYQQGQTDFLSVLQAQRDLYASQDAMVQSTQAVSTDLVALYKSLGGGWEIEKDIHPEPPPGEPGKRTLNITKLDQPSTSPAK